MDPLSITTGVLGLIGQVLTAAEYINKAYHAARDKQELDARCTGVLKELHSLEMLLKNIEARRDRDTRLFARALQLTRQDGDVTRLENELKVFIAEHRAFSDKASKMSSTRKFIKRSRWPLDKAGVQELLEHMRTRVASIRFQLQDDMYELNLAIYDNTRFTADQLKEDSLLAMLDWIAPVPLQAPLNRKLDSRLQEQVLEEDPCYQLWATGADSQLRYSGEPGTGKVRPSTASPLQLLTGSSSVFQSLCRIQGPSNQIRIK